MDLSGFKSHVPFFLTKLLKVQAENYKLKYERSKGEGKASAAFPPPVCLLEQLHSQAIGFFEKIKSRKTN